ncbi:MAG: SDR family NAD(P)-dependent oxidoreductase [Halioglobus sp.]
MNTLGTLCITSESSLDFATLSGDFNPLHLDPVAARRTQFGRTLIHGVCGTLQALDLWLAGNPEVAALNALKVRYARPITQGEDITVLAQSDAEGVRLELVAGGARCQVIEMCLLRTDPGARLQPEFREPSAQPRVCEAPSIDNCQGDAGAVELIWDPALARRLFPHACAALPARQLASLIATTQIVGMKCPGLHSVYSNLELQFADAADLASNSQLHYRVETADARFNRVVLSVGNAYVQGAVEAFFRAKPANQARMAEVVATVPPDCFTGQRALLVGASRGLGEVMAKVLAAGGAEVALTYARGKSDAETVADDIASERARPIVLQHDVLAGEPGAEVAAFCDDMTHLYYLASPIIDKGESGRWNGELFRTFCRFYIDGLATLLEHLQRVVGKQRQMHVFVPSSVFLDGNIKGFDEYIAAKHAAESYAARFSSANANWSLSAPRLPRLHTDQTSGVADSGPEETLQVVVAMLREICPAGQAPSR